MQGEEQQVMTSTETQVMARPAESGSEGTATFDLYSPPVYTETTMKWLGLPALSLADVRSHKQIPVISEFTIPTEISSGVPLKKGEWDIVKRLAEQHRKEMNFLSFPMSKKGLVLSTDAYKYLANVWSQDLADQDGPLPLIGTILFANNARKWEDLDEESQSVVLGCIENFLRTCTLTTPRERASLCRLRQNTQLQQFPGKWKGLLKHQPLQNRTGQVVFLAKSLVLSSFQAMPIWCL